MVRTEPRSYENSAGEPVSTTVLIMDAVVKTIPSNVKTNKGGNQAQWRLCKVIIDSPDGLTKVEKPAQLWESSYEMFADEFAVGQSIEIEVQTEGAGLGLAKMQLPKLERIEVAEYLALVSTETI